MLVDRDLWIDAFYNVSGFTKEGLRKDLLEQSHGGGPAELDRPGSNRTRGPRREHKYFKLDPAEAQSCSPRQAAPRRRDSGPIPLTSQSARPRRQPAPKATTLMFTMVSENSGGIFEVKQNLINYLNDGSQTSNSARIMGFDGSPTTTFPSTNSKRWRRGYGGPTVKLGLLRKAQREDSQACSCKRAASSTSRSSRSCLSRPSVSWHSMPDVNVGGIAEGVQFTVAVGGQSRALSQTNGGATSCW